MIYKWQNALIVLIIRQFLTDKNAWLAMQANTTRNRQKSALHVRMAKYTIQTKKPVNVEYKSLFGTGKSASHAFFRNTLIMIVMNASHAKQVITSRDKLGNVSRWLNE